MGGSCHCEPEVADYLAGRHDWDFATLELSVNMVAHFTQDEFSERVSYLVKNIAECHPEKPVLCIPLFPFESDLCHDSKTSYEKVQDFRQILRDIVATSRLKNLYLIEGSELLSSIDGLDSDFLHPSDHGMILMGENLANRLRPLISSEITGKSF